MSKAKSEMTFVHEAIGIAEANGFKKWPGTVPASQLTPGSRWYAVNRDRTIALFVIGRQPITSGTRIVNAHIDAVRVELKPKPFHDELRRRDAGDAAARRPEELPVGEPAARADRADRQDRREDDLGRHRQRSRRPGVRHPRSGAARRQGLPRSEEPRRHRHRGDAADPCHDRAGRDGGPQGEVRRDGVRLPVGRPAAGARREARATSASTAS